MEQIERVQKLATKWMSQSIDPYKDQLVKLKLLPLSIIYIYNA